MSSEAISLLWSECTLDGSARCWYLSLCLFSVSKWSDVWSSVKLDTYWLVTHLWYVCEAVQPLHVEEQDSEILFSALWLINSLSCLMIDCCAHSFFFSFFFATSQKYSFGEKYDNDTTAHKTVTALNVFYQQLHQGQRWRYLRIFKR